MRNNSIGTYLEHEENGCKDCEKGWCPIQAYEDENKKVVSEIKKQIDAKFKPLKDKE